MSRILVVDDSLTQRQLIADLLTESGFSVTTAENGFEALEKIDKLCPDVIILDIVMPQMTGYELCRRLKANPKTKDIPIIFCSTKSTQVDHYWGLKQGADAYLVKPFPHQELIGTVKKFLRQAKLT